MRWSEKDLKDLSSPLEFPIKKISIPSLRENQLTSPRALEKPYHSHNILLHKLDEPGKEIGFHMNKDQMRQSDAKHHAIYVRLLEFIACLDITFFS